LHSSGISAQTQPDSAAMTDASRRCDATGRAVAETATPASGTAPGDGAKAQRLT
jgi:hypothetical protein